MDIDKKKLIICILAGTLVLFSIGLWRMFTFDMMPPDYSSKVVKSTASSNCCIANLAYNVTGAAGAGNSIEFVEVEKGQTAKFVDVLVSNYVSRIDWKDDTLVIRLSKDDYDVIDDKVVPLQLIVE